MDETKVEDDGKTERVAELLKTLANPGRIKIVTLLSQQRVLSPSQIQEQTAMSYVLIAQHLIKMNNRGIVNKIRRGKEAYYMLADPMFTEWLIALWKVGQQETKIV